MVPPSIDDVDIAKESSASSVELMLTELGIDKSVDQDGRPIFTIAVASNSTQRTRTRRAQFHTPSKSWRLFPHTEEASSPNPDDVFVDPVHMFARSPAFSDDDPFQQPQQRRTSSVDNRKRVSSDPGSVAPGGLIPRPMSSWTDYLSPRTDHTRFFIETDWAATPLGPLETWSPLLRLMTHKLFTDPRAACIYWGPDRIAIYNDGFVPLILQVHPMLMGCPYRLAFPSTWEVIRHVFESVECTKTATHIPVIELAVERNGYLEETFFDGAFIPLKGETGLVEGFYNSVYEITRERVTDRRSNMLNILASTPDMSETTIWQHLCHTIETLGRDIPMAILYSAEEDVQSQRCRLRLEGSVGIHPGHRAAPQQVEIHESAEGFLHSFRQAKEKDGPVVFECLPPFLADGVAWRGFGEPSRTVVVLPFLIGGLAAGFLVIGLNPRRVYDEDYQRFVQDLRLIASTTIKASIDFQKLRVRELQLSRELSEKEKFVRRLAELAPVGMFNLDTDGVLTWANAKYYEITGLSSKPEDNFELSFMNCILEEDREKAAAEWEKSRLLKSPSSSTLRIKRTWSPPMVDESQGPPALEHAWVLSAVVPVLGPSNFKGVMGCVTDISKLKWAEKVQADAARVAQEAKLQQEKFVDITSHEIRNPLSAVVQCADSILTSLRSINGAMPGVDRQELLEEVKDCAHTIVALTTHQHRIVDDILTLSKLDSGMLPLALVSAETSSIVRDTMKMFEAQLESSDIKASLSFDRSINDLRAEQVCCDPSRIRQILINLMTNAIKFTKHAAKREIRVKVGASLSEPSSNLKEGHQWFPTSVKRKDITSFGMNDRENQVYINFSVEDTGKGILAEEMARLFTRFAQANIKTHINYGGSGLGLFISREITEMHGGMIGANSTLGEGSTFEFYIKASRANSPEQGDSPRLIKLSLRDKPSSPQSPARFPTASETRSFRRKNIHILLVEDNILNQKVLSKQLRKAGCTVHVANHGGEAIDFLPQTRNWSDRAPDSEPGLDLSVVLMDWEMPVMDGVACSKRIRQLEKGGQIKERLTIVGTTANAREAQIMVALEAGMDDVVTKPFTVPELMQRIENLF